MSKATREKQWKERADDDDSDWQRSLVQVALEVHMTVTGMYERAQEAQEEDVALLRLAIETWEPSSSWIHKAFDDSVKKLIEVAIGEYEIDSTRRCAND